VRGGGGGGGGGGDGSLGRLLGAGREAPIIVAGDRSETSPGNPGSSARKSCHQGFLGGAPSLPSSLSASSRLGGGETRGPIRAGGLAGPALGARIFSVRASHRPSKIESLAVKSVLGEFSVSSEWEYFLGLL